MAKFDALKTFEPKGVPGEPEKGKGTAVMEKQSLDSNRDLSWLKCSERVPEEAKRKAGFGHLRLAKCAGMAYTVCNSKNHRR